MDSLVSPSKARRNATTARDWAHVATWLTAKFHPASVPRFERNEETLRVLLKLLRENERADELGELVDSAAEAEVEEVERRQQWGEGVADTGESRSGGGKGGEIKSWTVDALRKGAATESVAAIDDLAATVVKLGCLDPTDSVEAGRAIVDLTNGAFLGHAQLRRAEELQDHVDQETRRVKARLEEMYLLRTSADGPVEGLGCQIGEWHRGSKMLALKLREYKDRVEGLERIDYVGTEIADLREREREVSRLQERRRGLQKGLREYGGLPPDWEAAIEELKRAEEELSKLKQRRDLLFEEMIE